MILKFLPRVDRACLVLAVGKPSKDYFSQQFNRITLNISLKVNRRYLGLWAQKILKQYRKQHAAAASARRDSLHIRRLVRLVSELDSANERPHPRALMRVDEYDYTRRNS